MQLEQLQVYIKQAVVRYFCRDVVGVRRKCAPSWFSLSDAPVSISEALKGISDGASKIYDHVTSNYRPPSKFGEVRTVSPHITMFDSIYAQILILPIFRVKSWALYFMSTYTDTKAKLVSKMKTVSMMSDCAVLIYF
jgi:hypothetical protein